MSEFINEIKPSGPGVFYVGRFLTTKTIYLIDVRLFSLSIFFECILADWIFQRICPLHLSCQIYGHKVISSILLMSVESVITYPFSSLIFVICVFSFSLFSSVCLVKGLILLNYFSIKIGVGEMDKGGQKV